MTERKKEDKAEDPGVPEALPRTLIYARAQLAPERLDRLWIFPPVRRGRKERGLVAASVFLEGEERRRLFTVTYAAERTGRGFTVDQALHEEGDAPPELLPRVMEGVVRRAGEAYGEPREVEIAGDPLKFDALVDEFDPELLAVDPA